MTNLSTIHKPVKHAQIEAQTLDPCRPVNLFGLRFWRASIYAIMQALWPAREPRAYPMTVHPPPGPTIAHRRPSAVLRALLGTVFRGSAFVPGKRVSVTARV